MNREDIIKEFLPLVKKVVIKMKNHLPSSVDVEDLLSAGYVGLVEAVNRYDPSSKQTFPYFAELKIRGAIYDYLRSLDILPKDKRKKVRKLEEMYDKLLVNNGIVETSDLIKELGITEEELMSLMRYSAAKYIDSLTQPFVEREDSYNLLSVLGSDEDPPKFLEESELFNLLTKAIESLSEREQLVLSLYYTDGFTFKEIGRILNVTESRVCQIHWRAVKKIREFMEKMGYEVCDGKSAGGG